MTSSLDADLLQRLEVLEAAGLRRVRRPMDSPTGREVVVAGRRLIQFASNDYLGLATHPAVVEAAAQAARDFGAGSGASRLLGGSLRLHHVLEEALADWKGTGAALTFSSGYAAALGVIPALVSAQDVIMLDRRVHACCVDAARMSGAALRVFRHNDPDHLDSLLRWARRRPGTHRILIVTESVFSMDGDRAPLEALVRLKEQHGAWLMLDEAHAAGLLGDRRSGLSEACGVSGNVEIHFGTLGKALGAAGGYVCGSRTLVDHLVNRARSLIFSTAPVPAAAGAAREALRVVQSTGGRERCETLWNRQRDLIERCPGLSSSSAIVPVPAGDERLATSWSENLLAEGLAVPAIRYPTVGRRQARLRVSLTASHQPSDIHRLATALNLLRSPV
ncbi:MAG: 8-amino-7-oxononanoate synthase [Verrucomicrobiae bacterium]|nr:8-amino-7-oxononanoate synthase [Verrucomicrobiae bacterium]